MPHPLEPKDKNKNASSVLMFTLPRLCVINEINKVEFIFDSTYCTNQLLIFEML
jgi:hypothetical protein